MIRLFRKPPPQGFQRHSLGFLNIAQFLGVVNDNLFKLILVFMLIQAQGEKEANTILSLAGAVFVIPFLLFSSSAGVLADRYSKQRILRYIKAVEIVILVLALPAFAFKSGLAGYSLLFLLAALHAVFGPSKYGIIPELVSKESIPKANGLITSFTYLGIIIGTFFASFMTEITNYNFLLVVSFSLILAIMGFIASFGVRYTPPQGSKKRFNPYFIREIFKTLHSVRSERHLLLAVSGSAFFLFIGAFAQLNIIPFAMQSLGLSEVAGGYLFLSTAFGIALGSFLAGKSSRKGIELSLSCFAALFIALFLLSLALFSHSLFLTLLFLFLLGTCGGAFIVPLDSFVQVFSPDEKRGQVIAASNFLGFTGVLIASFAIYLFGEVLHLSSAGGFLLLGVITFFFALLLIFRLSDTLFHFLSRKLLIPRYFLEKPDLSLLATYPSAPLIACRLSSKETFLLLGAVPHLRLFFLKGKRRLFPWFENLFYSLHLISHDATLPRLIEAKKRAVKNDERICLVGEELLSEVRQPTLLKTLFTLGAADVLQIDFAWDADKKQATLTFSKVAI